MMKRISLLMGFFCTVALSAQVSTEPKDIDPEATLKIIVNLQQLDQTKDYVQNLIDTAANGGDIYMWTFSPAEHPASHPLVNGTGAQPWKNSNEALKMTKEDEFIYSYTLIPTEFYEVTAQEVYDKDIKFLVKSKDGGGFGDPDVKSDDLTVEVNPPSLEFPPAYGFPSKPQGDDIVTIYYDNDRETKPSMQNLGANECFVYAEATLTDSTEIKISNLNQVFQNPELQMEYLGANKFRKFLIPNQFFNVPDGVEIETMTFVVIKGVSFVGPGQRVNNDIEFKLSCD